MTHPQALSTEGGEFHPSIIEHQSLLNASSLCLEPHFVSLPPILLCLEPILIDYNLRKLAPPAIAQVKPYSESLGS
jgi:hypothetical protein